MSTTYRVAPERHNDIVRNPTVLTLIRYLARNGLPFSTAALIDYFDGIAEFPIFTPRHLIGAAGASGVELKGEHVSFADARYYPVPFLTYLETMDDGDTHVQLVEIVEFTDKKVLVSDGPKGLVSVPTEIIANYWCGPVFRAFQKAGKEPLSDLEFYRYQVNILPSVLPKSVCEEMVQYCETHMFRRSAVTNFDPRTNEPKSAIEQKVRNSTSVTLEDRRHPLLARLYKIIARIEDVGEFDIEEIQCVRYKKGQRFTSHFDAATGVPRKMTYLLYLNDGFGGGQTHFPMLGLDVKPEAGSCLRFPSCDEEGRIHWQSEHGGMPVLDGTKYALNIWVNLPSPNQDDTHFDRAGGTHAPAGRAHG